MAILRPGIGQVSSPDTDSWVGAEVDMKPFDECLTEGGTRNNQRASPLHPDATFMTDMQTLKPSASITAVPTLNLAEEWDSLDRETRRTKISHDPNNTKWARSETSFGKKILQSHGWTPGALLGALDAPHADLHTAANATHVRISLKDDNLGLGATRGSGQAEGECTGLDVFQRLLGRLNGKSEIQQQQEDKSLGDLRRTSYLENRWGRMNFIKAGLLVGDKVYGIEEGGVEDSQIYREKDKESGPDVKKETSSDAGIYKLTRKRRKGRKDEVGEAAERLDMQSSTPARSEHGDIDGSEDAEKSRRRRKLDRRRRKSSMATVQDASESPSKRTNPKEEVSNLKELEPLADNAADAKRKRKIDRRERKEARRLRKESRHKTVKDDVSNAEKSCDSPLSNHIPSESIVKDGSSSTSLNAPINPFTSGRHAVRQRYILQKKMAVGDPKAMNEIFMIKA
ncbi:MAG: telomerase inhibitor [Sclerophora amabilis]|nr:MAG: telomerase inhibitor [Sclerophora amabilis]